MIDTLPMGNLLVVGTNIDVVDVVVVDATEVVVVDVEVVLVALVVV